MAGRDAPAALGLLAPGCGLASGEPVGLGAGFDDVGVVGDPVDDGGDEAGVGDDGAPFIWNWHTFDRWETACQQGVVGVGGDPRSSRRDV